MWGNLFRNGPDDLKAYSELGLTVVFGFQNGIPDGLLQEISWEVLLGNWTLPGVRI